MSTNPERVRFEYGSAEPCGDGWWTFQQRSAGEPTRDSLHTVLRWILQQLNFGNWISERDENGEIVSLTIGRNASAELGRSKEEAIEEANNRFIAVSIAGLIAKAQQEGTTANSKELVDKAIHLGRTNRNPKMNLQFHYALTLVGSIERMTKRVLKLASLGIHDKAPAPAVSLLREATTCHLQRLSQASIALSRAALECSLRSRITQHELEVERRLYPSRGELENLINAAQRCGYLDDALAGAAHRVRHLGNALLHSGDVVPDAATEALYSARVVIARLFE